MANFSMVTFAVFLCLAWQTHRFLALDQSICAYLTAREKVKASSTLHHQEWACFASSQNCELFGGSSVRREKLLASSFSFSFWSKIHACSRDFTGLTCRCSAYFSRDDFAHSTGLSNTFASPSSNDSKPNWTWSIQEPIAHSKATPFLNWRSLFSLVLSKYAVELCQFQSPALTHLRERVCCWLEAVRKTHELKDYQWARYFYEFGYFCGLPNCQS